MDSSESSLESSSEDESNVKNEIREELQSMSLEEILKLKEDLGSKLYNTAVLGLDDKSKSRKNSTATLKRLNKNRPREMPSNRQVPFLGAELRKNTKTKSQSEIRDPRFDDKCGRYDSTNFKKNYEFLSTVRENEITQIKEQLIKTSDREEKVKIKNAMQRLINKNVEDRKWHANQAARKKEQQNIQKVQSLGKQPHFITKKERRMKDLVERFKELKETGKLHKHIEKQRKKNTAKDRKKISFD